MGRTEEIDKRSFFPPTSETGQLFKGALTALVPFATTLNETAATVVFQGSGADEIRVTCRDEQEFIFTGGKKSITPHNESGIEIFASLGGEWDVIDTAADYPDRSTISKMERLTGEFMGNISNPEDAKWLSEAFYYSLLVERELLGVGVSMLLDRPQARSVRRTTAMHDIRHRFPNGASITGNWEEDPRLDLQNPRGTVSQLKLAIPDGVSYLYRRFGNGGERIEAQPGDLSDFITDAKLDAFSRGLNAAVASRRRPG